MSRIALLAIALLAAGCPAELPEAPVDDTAFAVPPDLAADTAAPPEDDLWSECGGLCACIEEALVSQCPSPPPAAPCSSTPPQLYLGLWLHEGCGEIGDLWPEDTAAW